MEVASTPQASCIVFFCFARPSPYPRAIIDAASAVKCCETACLTFPDFLGDVYAGRLRGAPAGGSASDARVAMGRAPPAGTHRVLSRSSHAARCLPDSYHAPAPTLNVNADI